MVSIAVNKAGRYKAVVFITMLNSIRVKDHFAKYLWVPPSPKADKSCDDNNGERHLCIGVITVINLGWYTVCRLKDKIA